LVFDSQNLLTALLAVVAPKNESLSTLSSGWNDNFTCSSLITWTARSVYTNKPYISRSGHALWTFRPKPHRRVNKPTHLLSCN